MLVNGTHPARVPTRLIGATLGGTGTSLSVPTAMPDRRLRLPLAAVLLRRQYWNFDTGWQRHQRLLTLVGRRLLTEFRTEQSASGRRIALVNGATGDIVFSAGGAQRQHRLGLYRFVDPDWRTRRWQIHVFQLRCRQWGRVRRITINAGGTITAGLTIAPRS